MTANNPGTSSRSIPWTVVFVAIAVMAVTQVPYLLGSRWAPPGSVYDGLVGMTDDQNMSFSFIRQGTEGHWLFVNRLTHLNHQPVLLNLEWLAVGRLIGWLKGSVTWAYAVWRLLGIVLLVAGFWSLTGAVGLNRFLRSLTLWLCAFGGGFGWMILAPERMGIIPHIPSAALDLSDAIHAFSHMFANPHLSVSHGMSLLFLAAFVAGEQTGKTRWYAMAAGVAALHGLVRPYDLIVMLGVIPLFILVERAITGKWSWRTTALRTLPLFVTAPVLGYYVALFRFHPVFKYWASQGEVEAVSVHWQLVNLGLAGLLFLGRLGWARRVPLKSSSERLLTVWIAGILLLMHGKHLPGLGFMPYAPVCGLALPSIMLVVGACLLEPLERVWHGAPAWRRLGLVAAFVAVNSISSVIWVAKITRNLAYLPDHYIAAEHMAHEWMSQRADPSDVLLSTLPSGNRMAKYVSCRFVLGHWSATPHVEELSKRVERFYGGTMTVDEATSLLDELHAHWIYFGPRERALGGGDPGTLRGVAPRYAKDDVQIFSYQQAGKSG